MLNDEISIVDETTDKPDFYVNVLMPDGVKKYVFKIDKDAPLITLLEYVKSLDDKYSNSSKYEYCFMLQSFELNLEKSSADNLLINNDTINFIAKVKETYDENENNNDIDEDPNKIILKVRIQNEKEPVKYRVQRTDPLSKIANIIAKNYNVDVSKVIIVFDGEKLSHSSTPEDNDLEDEDLLDVIIKS